MPKNPFGGRFDPGSYFATKNCREVWNSIIYGITRGKGFILLTGESGVGKTTLLTLVSLFLSIRGPQKVIRILPTPNSIGEILQAVLQNLGLSGHEESKSSMISRINENLIQRHSGGKRDSHLR